MLFDVIILEPRTKYVSMKHVRLLFSRTVRIAKIKTKAISLSVNIVGVKKMQQLNETYRGKHAPTNVLSFCTEEGSDDVFSNKKTVKDIGDIFLCPAVIKKEAKIAKVSFDAHLDRLLVHGFLHLFCFDHEAPHEAKAMELLESKILRTVISARALKQYFK